MKTRCLVPGRFRFEILATIFLISTLAMGVGELSAQAARPPKGKKAIIYVDANLSDAERNSIIDHQLKEEDYYKSLGYQVEVVRTSDFHKAVLDDLWNGMSAMSFFGHGGDEYTSYLPPNKTPTIGVNTGKEWQRDVNNDMFNRYQKDLNLSPEEASRRAKADSQNFGLDIMRNYSCFAANDNSIAKVFVKPGGLYFGAARYRAGNNPITELATACTPGFIADVVGSVSAYNLTQYRVSRTGELQPVDSRVQDHYDNTDQPSEEEIADMEGIAREGAAAAAAAAAQDKAEREDGAAGNDLPSDGPSQEEHNPPLRQGPSAPAQSGLGINLGALINALGQASQSTPAPQAQGPKPSPRRRPAPAVNPCADKHLGPIYEAQRQYDPCL